MRIRTTFLLFLFCSTFLGQTDIVKNLTTWVNPKRDSIKALKLKDAITFKIIGNDKKIESKKSYSQDGYVLSAGDYFFKYDAQNNLTYIKYPDPVSRMNLAFDSMPIDKNVDTNKVFRALYMYNRIFYNKDMRKIFDDRKKMKLTSDTAVLCDGIITKNNSIYAEHNGCSISKLILPSKTYTGKGYIETYKYDFSSQPPNIEFIQRDTSGKFEKIYSFMASYPTDGSQIFNGYNLLSVLTTIRGKEFDEEIFERYTDNQDKRYSYPVFIDHTFYYPTYREYKEYKCSSLKNKKLVSSYILKTEYSYYR